MRLKAVIQILESALEDNRPLCSDAAVIELTILHSHVFTLWMTSPKAVSTALELPEPAKLCISTHNANSSIEDTLESKKKLISGAWLAVVQSLAALRECRRLDTFHFKAVYRVSDAIYRLERSHLLKQAPAFVFEALQVLDIGGSPHQSGILELSKLFDKKRPQIVAMWIKENSNSPWEQVRRKSIANK